MHPARETRVLCGAAAEDITPAPGVEMSGYVARRQPSTGVHDPLYARALYIEEAGQRLLWLHADVIAFEGADVARLKESLRVSRGFPPDRVMVTATHTHSGPAVVRLNRCGAYDAAEVERIFAAFFRLADAAMASAEPAVIVRGEGACGLGVHRRPSDRPHTDPRLPVLGFRRDDGSYIAVLAMYAMHNVAMGGENTLFSADVAGRAAEGLARGLPGRPTVLWLNGACGNVNPPSVAGDFARVRAWGDELAAAARAALDDAAPVPMDLRCAAVPLILAPDALSPEEAVALAWQRTGRGAPVPEGPNAWVEEAIRAAARDWRAQMADEDPATAARRAAPAILQAVALGGAAWIGVPGEPFSNLNVELGERTGHTMYVVGYANGDVGYLCPSHAYDEGGYEPDGAFFFYGTRPIPRGAYERIREAAANLVRDLMT